MQIRSDAKLQRIQELLDGRTDAPQEKEIVDILKSTDSVELDHILTRANLDRLISDVDTEPYRKDMLHYLTRQRLGDVTVDNRRRLVDAMQHGSTDRDLELAAAAILLGTRGQQLTQLKNAIDDGGDHHDLQQLVYHDIDHDGIRNDLLRHFQTEAVPTGELKVLSDIDDTFYSSLKDPRYPKGTVYPGVKQYYHELDRGRWSSDGHDGDLAFVTARPGDRTGFVKDRTLRMLHENGLQDCTVLAGSFSGLIGRERMARAKYQNFHEYRTLFPEYQFAFTGDSGQADPRFGEMLLTNAPDVTKGVFIHDVVATPPQKRDEFRRKGILFFDTYVGAALEAMDRGLLSLEATRRIAVAALQDLERVRFASPEQEAARQAEFRQDVSRLNALLPEDQRLPIP